MQAYLSDRSDTPIPANVMSDTFDLLGLLQPSDNVEHLQARFMHANTDLDTFIDRVSRTRDKVSVSKFGSFEDHKSWPFLQRRAQHCLQHLQVSRPHDYVHRTEPSPISFEGLRCFVSMALAQVKLDGSSVRYCRSSHNQLESWQQSFLEAAQDRDVASEMRLASEDVPVCIKSDMIVFISSIRPEPRIVSLWQLNLQLRGDDAIERKIECIKRALASLRTKQGDLHAHQQLENDMGEVLHHCHYASHEQHNREGSPHNLLSLFIDFLKTMVNFHRDRSWTGSRYITTLGLSLDHFQAARRIDGHLDHFALDLAYCILARVQVEVKVKVHVHDHDIASRLRFKDVIGGEADDEAEDIKCHIDKFYDEDVHLWSLKYSSSSPGIPPMHRPVSRNTELGKADSSVHHGSVVDMMQEHAEHERKLYKLMLLFEVSKVDDSHTLLQHYAAEHAKYIVMLEDAMRRMIKATGILSKALPGLQSAFLEYHGRPAHAHANGEHPAHLLAGSRELLEDAEEMIGRLCDMEQTTGERMGAKRIYTVLKDYPRHKRSVRCHSVENIRTGERSRQTMPFPWK